MTALPTIDPCECGNDDLQPREGMSSQGPAFTVRCDNCWREGFADETAEGAVDYWNLGDRIKRWTV
jgi:hypothetical protein